jgi:hypothetical protein
MRTMLLVLTLAAGVSPAFAQSETVLEVESRGQKVRSLLLRPANPGASVILLAGGHGKLDLGVDGRIGWGAGNQLVRTRAGYAQAGFVTAVPDIAPDLKTPGGVVNYYRINAPHAQDIGALVTHLRAHKSPVVVVGTSRGAISAANAVAKLSGAARPDAMVLTAAMLMTMDAKTPSVQRAAGDDAKRLQIPTLIVGHKKDRCRWTEPSSITAFKAWYERGGRTPDVVILDGPEGRGDPCEAQSAHGFAGIDGQVVTTVTGWIKNKNLGGK